MSAGIHTCPFCFCKDWNERDREAEAATESALAEARAEASLILAYLRRCRENEQVLPIGESDGHHLIDTIVRAVEAGEHRDPTQPRPHRWPP